MKEYKLTKEGATKFVNNGRFMNSIGYVLPVLIIIYNYNSNVTLEQIIYSIIAIIAALIINYLISQKIRYEKIKELSDSIYILDKECLTHILSNNKKIRINLNNIKKIRNHKHYFKVLTTSKSYNISKHLENCDDLVLQIKTLIRIT